MTSSTELSIVPNPLVSTPICNMPSAEIFTVIPSCDDTMKPKVGQIFSTLEAAVAFYENYAAICGFTTRLGTSLRARGGNVLSKRRIVCNKEGKRQENNNKKSDRVHLITRVGCNAMIHFTRLLNGSYSVSVFNEVHNHMLVSPKSMMFMKGKRSMTLMHKNYIVKASRLKLGPVRAFRGWKELSGGYGNVGASENDFKNFVRDLKSYIGDFDGQMFIENFIRKKETCPTFFFDFEVDESQRLNKVFWADPICRKNYVFFGEMVSIDATFSTNKYDMKFVPITGVDNHKRCVVLGAGLLTNEDVESYTWLFKAFLECTGGCPPRVIITDQDPAMKIAIAEVFPNSTHRLCMWHIMKKLREKVSAQLWQDDNFKKRFNGCVWNNYLNREEFESEWESIIIDFSLEDHPWFDGLKKMREEWIPAYFNDIFMGGLMRVTSRSESENSFFDRFITSKVTLVEFWMCFESAIDTQRYKQSKLNTENKHFSVPLKTPLELEKDASNIYTHAIFKEFQEELYAALFFCGMVEVCKVGDVEVYRINDTELDSKIWKVEYKEGTEDMSCSCCLFQRMGLLCRHIIWVLKSKNKKKIPQKYIVDRWTKNALKTPVFDKFGNVMGDDYGMLVDKKRLLTEVWEGVYSCVSLSEDNDDDLQFLVEKLKDLKLEIEARITNGSLITKKVNDMERYVGCSIPTEFNIQPPKKTTNKGSGKRIESSVLKALSRSALKRRTCSRCNKKGHNSRTCAQVLEEEIEEDTEEVFDSEAEQDEHEEGNEDEEAEGDNEEEEETSRATVSKTQRVCSNCGKKGHNSRTCVEAK